MAHWMFLLFPVTFSFVYAQEHQEKKTEGRATVAALPQVQVDFGCKPSPRMLSPLRIFGSAVTVGYHSEWISGHPTLIRQFDLRTGAPVGQAFKVGTNLHALRISRDGRRAVTGTRDDKPLARIYDVPNQKLLREIPNAVISKGMIGISDDGKVIVSSLDKGFVEARDSDTGKVLWKAQPMETSSISITSDDEIVFSADGKRLILGGKDAGSALGIAVLNARSGKQEFKYVSQSPNAPFGPFALAPQGDLVAVNHDGVEIFDISSGKRLAQIARPTENGVVADISISPDGRFLAFTTYGFGEAAVVTHQKLHLHALPSGQKILTEDHPTGAGQVEFSSDGNVLVVSGHGNGRANGSSTEKNCIAQVKSLERLRKASPYQLSRIEEHWRTLGSADPIEAYLAKQFFQAMDTKGIEVFRKKLVLPPLDAKTLAGLESNWNGLVARLNDENYAVRDRATAEMAQLAASDTPSGFWWLNRINESITNKSSNPEAHWRLGEILTRAEATEYSPETRNRIEAVGILLSLPQSEAKTLLQDLTKGHALDPVAATARSAMGLNAP